MKKLIAILLVLCLVLAGCKSDVVTEKEAQKIVLEDLGMKASQVTFHVHAGSGDVPCYLVYATVEDHTLEYVIHAVSGEILAVTESSHSH